MGAVNPPPANARERLLAATARILATEGPAGLTVARLARDLGSSTMAVYASFSGKPELIAATVDEFVSRFSAALRAVPHQDDALAEVIELARAYREIALANHHLYRVAFQSGRLSLSADGPLGVAETHAYCAGVFKRCVEQGVLAPNDPVSMLQSCWASIHGQVSLELEQVFPTPAAAAAAWGELHRVVLTGLGAEPANLAGRPLTSVVAHPA